MFPYKHLNNKINSVSFTEFVEILTTGPFLVLTLANTKGLTTKWKIYLGGLINGTQVNIFWEISLNTENLKYLRNVWITCTLDCFCQIFIRLVSHSSGTMVHSRLGYLLLKKNAHALAIRCTDDKTDIVLEVKKLNIISFGGNKRFLFFRNQLLGLFKTLNKSQLTFFVECHLQKLF